METTVHNNNVFIITAVRSYRKLGDEIAAEMADSSVAEYISVAAAKVGADTIIADLEAASGTSLDDAQKLEIIFNCADEAPVYVEYQAHPAGACLPKGARPVGVVLGGRYEAFDATLIPADVAAVVAATTPFAGDAWAELR